MENQEFTCQATEESMDYSEEDITIVKHELPDIVIPEDYNQVKKDEIATNLLPDIKYTHNIELDNTDDFEVDVQQKQIVAETMYTESSPEAVEISANSEQLDNTPGNIEYRDISGVDSKKIGDQQKPIIVETINIESSPEAVKIFGPTEQTANSPDNIENKVITGFDHIEVGDEQNSLIPQTVNKEISPDSVELSAQLIPPANTPDKSKATLKISQPCVVLHRVDEIFPSKSKAVKHSVPATKKSLHSAKWLKFLLQDAQKYSDMDKMYLCKREKQTIGQNSTRLTRSQNPRPQNIESGANENSLQDRSIQNNAQNQKGKRACTLVSMPLKRKKGISAESPLDTASVEEAGCSKTLKLDTCNNNKEGKDRFCWECHLAGVGIYCESCQRAFHIGCLAAGAAADPGWLCPVCLKIKESDNTETISPKLKNLPVPLSKLLQFVIRKMVEYKSSGPFIFPVNENLYQDYRDFIIQPMNITTLKNNVQNQLYKSTEAFIADARYILHNCVIFNGSTAEITKAADLLLKTCLSEISELHKCPGCYFKANTEKHWFVDLCCKKPHLLLWAKFKDHPYWPAKLIGKDAKGKIEVRFFGTEGKGLLAQSQCYLFSRRHPNITRSNQNLRLRRSIRDAEKHIKKIKKVFGEFRYAAHRTKYDPAAEEEQLVSMIPTYRSEMLQTPVKDKNENTGKEKLAQKSHQKRTESKPQPSTSCIHKDKNKNTRYKKLLKKRKKKDRLDPQASTSSADKEKKQQPKMSALETENYYRRTVNMITPPGSPPYRRIERVKPSNSKALNSNKEGIPSTSKDTSDNNKKTKKTSTFRGAVNSNKTEKLSTSSDPYENIANTSKDIAFLSVSQNRSAKMKQSDSQSGDKANVNIIRPIMQKRTNYAVDENKKSQVSTKIKSVQNIADKLLKKFSNTKTANDFAESKIQDSSSDKIKDFRVKSDQSTTKVAENGREDTSISVISAKKQNKRKRKQGSEQIVHISNTKSRIKNETQCVVRLEGNLQEKDMPGRVHAAELEQEEVNSSKTKKAKNNKDMSKIQKVNKNKISFIVLDGLAPVADATERTNITKTTNKDKNNRTVQISNTQVSILPANNSTYIHIDPMQTIEQQNRLQTTFNNDSMEYHRLHITSNRTNMGLLEPNDGSLLSMGLHRGISTLDQMRQHSSIPITTQDQTVPSISPLVSSSQTVRTVTNSMPYPTSTSSAINTRSLPLKKRIILAQNSSSPILTGQPQRVPILNSVRHSTPVSVQTQISGADVLHYANDTLRINNRQRTHPPAPNTMRINSTQNVGSPNTMGQDKKFKTQTEQVGIPRMHSQYQMQPHSPHPNTMTLDQNVGIPIPLRQPASFSTQTQTSSHNTSRHASDTLMINNQHQLRPPPSYSDTMRMIVDQYVANSTAAIRQHHRSTPWSTTEWTRPSSHMQTQLDTVNMHNQYQLRPPPSYFDTMQINLIQNAGGPIAAVGQHHEPSTPYWIRNTLEPTNQPSWFNNPHTVTSDQFRPPIPISTQSQISTPGIPYANNSRSFDLQNRNLQPRFWNPEPELLLPPPAPELITLLPLLPRQSNNDRNI